MIQLTRVKNGYFIVDALYNVFLSTVTELCYFMYLLIGVKPCHNMRFVLMIGKLQFFWMNYVRAE